MEARLMFTIFVCLSAAAAYEDVTLMEYINTHNFLIFKNLVEEAGLTQILSQTGPYSIFVPTDDAFAKFGLDVINGYSSTQLKSIIKYHIVDSYLLLPMVSGSQNMSTLLGEPLKVQNQAGAVILNGLATVDGFKADNIVNNGVIQPVDTVLMPPAPYLTGETIAQVLIEGDNQFNDLLLAFMFAEMINLLEHNEFTVFAPTDAAFYRHREHIMRPDDPDISPEPYQEVLKYHIVPGSLRIADLTDGEVLHTLNGESITIQRNTTGVFVEYAMVIEADIFAANGFIHAIDDVLIPPYLQGDDK